MLPKPMNKERLFHNRNVSTTLVEIKTSEGIFCSEINECVFIYNAIDAICQQWIYKDIQRLGLIPGQYPYSGINPLQCSCWRGISCTEEPGVGYRTRERADGTRLQPT